MKPLQAGSLSWPGFLLLITSLLSLVHLSLSENKQYVQTTTDTGAVVYLEDNRKPSLYTQNFGDCLGSSLINVTRFDAAYYKDNMTVLFHLEGNTNVANESIMSTYLGRSGIDTAKALQCTLVSLLMASLALILPLIPAMRRYTGTRPLTCLLDAF